MNIEKKAVRGSILKKEKKTQITMDRDMNVPDTCPDIEKIADSRGKLQIHEVEIMQDKIRIRGVLLVEILYLSIGSARQVQRMEHEYGIDEIVNIEGIKSEDNVWVDADLEDLSVHIINSRKCGFKTVISFFISVSRMQIVQCSVGVESGNQVECLYGTFPVTEIIMDKKDIQRIKTTVELPAGKANMMNILWLCLRLNDVETKMLDRRIAIKGNMYAFVLYEGEENNAIIQSYDWEIPFSHELECSDSREGLIGDISVKIGTYQMSIRPDRDGENRQLEIEAVLNLHMKAYDEYSLKYLKDLYACDRKLIKKEKGTLMENLIFQNKARHKVNYRLRDNDFNQLLQILSVEGTIQLETYHKEKNGILTEGLIFAKILYITSDDDTPIQSKDMVIPFEYLAEAQDTESMERCEIKCVLEQISGSVLDGNEVEIRTTAGIYLTGYKKEKIEMIENVEEMDFTLEEMEKIPSITGYLVRKGDTLWNIAKHFRTTVNQIKNDNELAGEELQIGQKLILLKRHSLFI